MIQNGAYVLVFAKENGSLYIQPGQAARPATV